MDENIENENKLNFETANLILIHIFSVCEIIILIIFKFLLYPKIRNIFFLKHKLFFIVNFDCISKLFSTINYNYFYPMLKELLFAMINSGIFYLILSFIYEIFYNSLIFIDGKKKIKLLNTIQISIIYFFVIFPYDKFYFSYPKVLSIFESLIIIIYLCNLFKYLRDIIRTIWKYLKAYNNSNENVYLYLQIANYASSILFILYYIGKIISILFYDFYFIIYIDILINIFNESLRYLLFYLFIRIIFILDDNYLLDNNSSVNKNDEEQVIIYNY